MTYSIIARDPQTEQMGVAVQTFNLAVGTWVPWAAGGVGAVATQALADRRYGTLGLDLMRGGYPAEQVLQALLAADPKRELRQVSMIDNSGEIATHTGSCCIPEAGSFAGDTFCTQANMMVRNTVWGAMAAAFQEARGSLANRLLVALDAAQAEGGDLRGKQTAALLVVEGRPLPVPVIDLRVDHHPQPLAELRRMLRLHQAYELEYEIGRHIDEGNTETIYDLVVQIGELAPDEAYLQCLCALHLERSLDLRAEALKILGPLVERQPQWRTYLEREVRAAEGCPLPAAGLDPQFLSALDANASAEVRDKKELNS
jgi:uncharacterized Ntn-hydrolase superfamily protein